MYSRRRELRGVKRKIDELGSESQLTDSNRKESKDFEKSSPHSSSPVDEDSLPDSSFNCTTSDESYPTIFSSSLPASTTNTSTLPSSSSHQFKVSLSSPPISSYYQLKGFLDNQQNPNYFYHKQRHLTFNLSMCKLNRYRQSSDPSLLRSVLICNTLKRLERELAKDGIRINFSPTGVTFVPTTSIATSTTASSLDGHTSLSNSSSSPSASPSPSSSSPSPPPPPPESTSSSSNHNPGDSSDKDSHCNNLPRNGGSSQNEDDVSGRLSSTESLCLPYIGVSNENESKYLLDLDSTCGRMTPYKRNDSEKESDDAESESCLKSLSMPQTEPLLSSEPTILSSSLCQDSSPSLSLSSSSSSSSSNTSSQSQPDSPPQISSSPASGALWSIDETYGSDRLTNLNWSSVLNFDTSSSHNFLNRDSCTRYNSSSLTILDEQSINEALYSAVKSSVLSMPMNESDEKSSSDSINGKENESNDSGIGDGCDNLSSKWNSSSDDSSSLHTLLPPSRRSESSSSISHLLQQHLNNGINYYQTPSTTLSASSSHTNSNDEIFGDIDLSLYDFDPISPLSPPSVKLTPLSAEELIKEQSSLADSSFSSQNSLSSSNDSSMSTSSSLISPPSSPTNSSSSTSSTSDSSPSSSSSSSVLSDASSMQLINPPTNTCSSSSNNSFFRGKEKLFIEDLPTTIIS